MYLLALRFPRAFLKRKKKERERKEKYDLTIVSDGPV